MRIFFILLLIVILIIIFYLQLQSKIVKEHFNKNKSSIRDKRVEYELKIDNPNNIRLTTKEIIDIFKKANILEEQNIKSVPNKKSQVVSNKKSPSISNIKNLFISNKKSPVVSDKPGIIRKKCSSNKGNSINRLEKTLRPNGYIFINKDNVEPHVRRLSEENAKYRHMKPGQSVFDSYGYSYMPPESWSVPQNRPPVCIPQKGYKAEALPLYTIGTPLNALEVNKKILPKSKYEEVYDPKYYYPGWISK